MKDSWLFIKTPDHYGKATVIEFDKNLVKYFDIEKSDNLYLMKVRNKNWNENWDENITEVEHLFINSNRIRFIKKGKKTTVLNEEEFITEDCIIEDDYEKLLPTETELSEIEIQNLKFELNWNKEKMKISFNEDLDSPFIQEINNRLNKKGNFILLEKLKETLFLSIYHDIYSVRLIPIKYVDKQKIVLYGFPEEPYEIDCLILE